MTRAVIYVPASEFDPHAARCLAHCERRGYRLQGIIRGRWVEADRMMRDGLAGVVIVSTEAHLDPDREPRIEVVAHQEVAPGVRRTRIIRRSGGA